MTTVVHWNDRPEEGWVYIGRPSPFGNPFTAKQYGREGAIERYRWYFHGKLARDPQFLSEVEALRGKVLVCHCKPLACHGDVIVQYLSRRTA